MTPPAKALPAKEAFSKPVSYTHLRENTPTMLYFGAQPGAEGFYEKNGCKRSLDSFVIEREAAQTEAFGAAQDGRGK